MLLMPQTPQSYRADFETPPSSSWGSHPQASAIYPPRHRGGVIWIRKILETRRAPAHLQHQGRGSLRRLCLRQMPGMSRLNFSREPAKYFIVCHFSYLQGQQSCVTHRAADGQRNCLETKTMIKPSRGSCHPWLSGQKAPFSPHFRRTERPAHLIHRQSPLQASPSSFECFRAP